MADDDRPGRGTRAPNGRASVGLGKDGYWHCWVSMGTKADGKADRRHVSGTTQSACAAQVEALEAARRKGVRGVGRTKATLGDYLAAWIERKRRTGNVRPKTVEGYRADLARIAPIANIKLARLSTANIEFLYAQMREAGHLASIEHVHRTLSACLNDATTDGVLGRGNPVKGTKRPRYGRAEITTYPVEEVVALLGAAVGQRNAVRWSLGLLLGMRRGEVLGLRWTDVDLDAGMLGSAPSYSARSGSTAALIRPPVARHSPARCATAAGFDCPPRSRPSRNAPSPFRRC